MLDCDAPVELGWKFILATIASIAGYFFPIRDILHLMFFFFILDVLIGFWAARKKTNTRFIPMIVWRKTVPRMILSTLLIIMLFLWDDISHQKYLDSANLAGWFINGLLIISIVENAYFITEWKVFNSLKWFIHDKVESHSNIKIDPENEKN
jgi:hypothetical protein